ncbi:MAG: hypothetical protein ACK4WJ_01180 [Endomicrobiia bacterium]
MKTFLLKNYKKILAIFIVILLVYCAIYIDVTLRARSAYLEAEKYVEWYYNPNKKIKFFEKEFNDKKKQLDKLLSENKLSKDEYDVKLEILEFEKERKIKESSLKYAYIWYKTVIELFSLPESKWVKLAKQKIVNIKQMWRKELEQKGYKIEDYMLE